MENIARLRSVEIKFDDARFADIPDARTDFNFNSYDQTSGIVYVLSTGGKTEFKSWTVIESVRHATTTPITPGPGYPYIHITFSDPSRPINENGIAKVGYDKNHAGLYFFDTQEKKLILIPWRHIAGITEHKA